MWKAALAGAVALATVGTLSISPHGVGIAPAAAEEIIVTEGQIARLHSALRLTSSQEHYWHAVAATLHSGQLMVTVGESQSFGGLVTGTIAVTRASAGAEFKSQMQFADVDLAIERQVVDALAKATGIGVHGEEFGGPELDSSWVWVLDPVDGTLLVL